MKLICIKLVSAKSIFSPLVLFLFKHADQNDLKSIMGENSG